MADLPVFQQYQFEFTRHIRDPRTNPRPAGVPARGMKVYNELLYNNIESFLLACFPVLREIVGSRKWMRLVRGFFATHRCHTPYFRQIPDEFLQFLQEEWEPETGYPSFMLELAHYEWIELVLSVSNRDPDAGAADPEGDLLARTPVLNPVLRLLAYDWPVHRLSKRFRPAQPGPEKTHLLVFRDAADDMRFVVLNLVSARLMALLGDGRLTGGKALLKLAQEMKHADPAAVVRFGAEILQDLRAEGAILGTAG